MLTEQITALEVKENELDAYIKAVEEDLKKTKAELTIVRKAKKNLESLQEQLNEQSAVPA